MKRRPAIVVVGLLAMSAAIVLALHAILNFWGLGASPPQDAGEAAHYFSNYVFDESGAAIAAAVGWVVLFGGGATRKWRPEGSLAAWFIVVAYAAASGTVAMQAAFLAHILQLVHEHHLAMYFASFSDAVDALNRAVAMQRLLTIPALLVAWKVIKDFADARGMTFLERLIGVGTIAAVELALWATVAPAANGLDAWGIPTFDEWDDDPITLAMAALSCCTSVYLIVIPWVIWTAAMRPGPPADSCGAEQDALTAIMPPERPVSQKRDYHRQ